MIAVALALLLSQTKQKLYSLDQYMAVSRAGDSSYSPDGDRIAYFSNQSGTWQLWVTDLHTLKPIKLSSFKTGISSAHWCPSSEEILVVVDQGGNQAYQFYTINAKTHATSRLTTDDKVEHNFGGWTRDGKSIYYADNSRNPKFFDCYVMDVASHKTQRILQKDAVLHPAVCSPDGNLIAIEESHSEVDRDITVVNSRSMKSQLVTKHSGHALFSAVGFSLDDSTVYFRTNEDGEFTRVIGQKLSSGKRTVIASSNHDIDLAIMDPTGSKIAISTNVDGYERPSIIDLATSKRSEYPELNRGICWPQRFSTDGMHLSVALNLPVHDDDIYDVDLQKHQVKRVTFSPQGGIDAKTLIVPTIIRYRSFDGRMIPAILYTPHGATPAKRAPVILSIHGGPEDQEAPYLINYYQFLVSRGYAILAPNVRGSTGYGKSYVDMDNGPKRWDAIKDYEYAIRWIKIHPQLNGSKVVCFGPSYGGFAALVMLSHYPKLCAGGIDFYGPTDLKTFLNRTASYRQANRIAEYGDPVKDSAFMDSISPAKHADRIVKPLLIVQGMEDPIVPPQESDAIVRLLRKRGQHVDYLLLPNEGHGISSSADYAKAFDAVLKFLQQNVPTK